MIQATSVFPAYRTQFTDGVHEGVADTTADKGGGDAGFRPHDLLAAALATCVNMTVRMYAEHHGIALRDVVTRVDLDRSCPGETTFRYAVELAGEFSPAERERLLAAASACPVRRTLSGSLRFESGLSAPLR